MKSKKDKDFRILFQTVTKHVDFSGCKTPEDINERIKAKIKQLKSKPRSPPTKNAEDQGVE